MQASSQSYEKTTNQLGSLLHLVSSQLQLSSSRLASHGGETGRRSSRSREEKQESTRRRSRRPSNTFEHKKKKEKHLNMSQSCTQHCKLLLDETHYKVISKKMSIFKMVRKEEEKYRNAGYKTSLFD